MRRGMIVLFVAVFAVLIGQGAFADSIAWREGGGGGYTDVTCDDTYTEHWNTLDHGSATIIWIAKNKVDGTGRFGLIGWKDLFTLVPPTSGGFPIVIDNALLTLAGAGGTNVVGDAGIVRMTTQWLLNAAGTNESNVHYEESDDADNVPWASGDLSTSDWTWDDEVIFSYTGKSWIDVYVVEITALMQALYDNGVNAGFGVHGAMGSSDDFKYASSEHGSKAHPALDMEYHYIPEPGTMLLVGTAVLGVLGYLRRRRMR